MTLTHDTHDRNTPCQGGCGKQRSILHSDDPEQWLCNECRTKQRLEYLRGELRAERISYGELHELQTLAKYIPTDDVELLEAAGVPETPRPTARVHFIAMSGTHGCLPDSCNAYATYDDAVEALVELFSLGRTRKARLYANRHLELRKAQDACGAEYCEITTCHCATPWEHCDAGADPRDWQGYPRQDAR